MHDVIPVSNGTWSWWLPVIFIGLAISGFIAQQAKERLSESPWWHTLLVAIATLLSSAVLTARHRDPDFSVFLIMLIPSFIGTALLYLALSAIGEG